MTPARPALGTATIALAILFNLPYALLAASFDYPAILRHPPAEVLARFAAGGAALVLTWYAFALAALALTPLAIAISVTPRRLAEQPALAVSAALVGALAGLTQAIGLMRWVFVVPDLARTAASGGPAEALAAGHAFAVIHAYGGVAIGEHLGQLLTALFVALMAIIQWREGHRTVATLGLLTAPLLMLGTGEGLMLALGRNGDTLALLTIAGFLGLTVWLIATGLGLLRPG
ncbi:DUF4386 family protein [Erythrobacter sp. BLCC-B19]|uniref:DUF4386 family protein n=1 Tax=Erythrobacter sp. BLCC-B19 TaxID=3025315 RepID=UPI00235FEAB3|nr:DUF4386 family protein [Erythrobacter sp. BLCC-B19]WDA39643.1 DUF4386 family protein [Erythrobacter sp. BLCC-B19]